MPVASPAVRAPRTRDPASGEPWHRPDERLTSGLPARGQHRHSQLTSTATSTANTTSVRTGIIGSRRPCPTTHYRPRDHFHARLIQCTSWASSGTGLGNSRSVPWWHSRQ